MMSEGSRRRVTYKQLEQLCEFLTSNREIAVGNNSTLQARYHSQNSWKAVSTTLNAHGDGAYKDWKGWCKYWTDYKSKLKKLAVALRAPQQRTDGQAKKNITEMEHKFLHILGEDFGSRIPKARVEPFEELQEIQQEESFEVYLPVYSLDSTGSISLVTPPVPTPPRAPPRPVSESGYPPVSEDSRTIISPQVPPISASLPRDPLSPSVEALMETAQSSPPHHQDDLIATLQNSPCRRRRLDSQTSQSPLRRRRRTRREPTTSAEASRRALIEVSDRRAEAEVNRNRILDERLQLIGLAVKNNNNNKELQMLTQAINNLTKTINSRFLDQM